MLKKFLIGAFFVAAFALVASSASADCSITTTLRVGSKGVEVSCLQAKVGATADGSFGPLTKASVMAYQSNHGLSADGVVGPLSRAVLNANAVVGTFPAGCTSASGFSSITGVACVSVNANTFAPSGCTAASGFSPVTGGACYATSSTIAGCTAGALFSSTTGASCTTGVVTTTTGPLVGSNGEIADINQLSQYSNEEVGSGSTNIKVMGFEVKASKDGDIALNTIKLTFDSNGNGATESDRIADYLTTVYVWQGSTKIATASTADFNKDSTGVYSKTIALSNSVVRSNTTEPFYVSVDAVSNLDSGDITADAWSVGINSIRYVDGSGVTTTFSNSEIATTAGTLDYTNAGDGVGISFVTFASASNTVLKISTNSTPAASVIKVSTTENTDNVTLLKGKMVLDGTSNVWLDEMPFTFTTDATNVDGVTPTVYLTIDGKTFSESMTATAGTTEVITFNNLDLTLTAGATYAFTVSADINDIEASSFDEGDLLKAELTATNRAAIVAENSQGDSLSGTELTGSALGTYQSFRSSSVAVALVGTPTAILSHAGDISNTSDSDQGTFTFTFDVTASGSDVYIDGTKPVEIVAASADAASGMTVIGADTYVDSSITSSTGATMTGTQDGDARFLVSDGDTERFTITYVTKPGVGGTGLFTVSVNNIRYALTDVTATTSYTFNLDNFKAPALSMQYDAN